MVFETTLKDYLYFLCYYGCKNQAIKSISGNNFSCSANSSADLKSNVNYPSISIARLDSYQQPVMTVTRTVTNVGPSNSTYTATVQAPVGFVVTVALSRLVFWKRGMKASYEVKFDVREANKGYRFGSVTVFAVNVV